MTHFDELMQLQSSFNIWNVDDQVNQIKTSCTLLLLHNNSKKLKTSSLL